MLLDHFGSTLGCLLDGFGVALVILWDVFWMTLCELGECREGHWGSFGSTLGAIVET